MQDTTGTDADALPLPEPETPSAPSAPSALPTPGPNLWHRIGLLWAAVFGTWMAPPWLRWTGHRAAQAAACTTCAIKARPGASAGAALAVALLASGGYFGHAWWQARPKPMEVSFVVSNPALTDFANAGLPQPMSVKFSQSVAPLAQVGKEVTAGISTTPAVAGTWHWTSDRQLDFTPKADWPVGTDYKVLLNRSAIAPQIQLDSYEFAFASAAFQATVRKAEFYQDPVNPAIKKVEIELDFSHPVNTAELEKRIELRLAGQAAGVLGVGRETTPFTVSYDKLKLRAYVHSAVIPIPKEDTALALTLDKGVPAQAGGAASKEALTASVPVPGLFSLSLAGVAVTVVTNERFEPEQVLILNTSQRVHEAEVAKYLAAWVLPLQNPRIKKEEQSEEPYAWSDAREITAEVLAASTRLSLAAIPAAQEQTQTHTFKLRADIGRMVYVQLDNKTRSFAGYLMRERGQAIVTVPPYPSELRILSQGALLPMSGEKKVAVLVRDLPGIRVELSRVQPAQLQHLVSQSRGNFASPEFIGNFGPDNLSDRYERKLPLPGLARGKPHYESIDLAQYLSKDGEHKRGLFLLKVQGYDPKAEAAAAAKAAAGPNSEAQAEPDSEHNEAESGQENADPTSHEERRLVLVTDLGLLVKQSTDGSRDVFVQSIYSGEPVAGVTVDVIAKNGSTLFSQTTDAAGRVHFDKLEGLARERAPLLLLARKGGDMSFMPLNRNDRQLDYSRFDVGGLQSARSQDQLSAYLFSDRGIYRPGETMHIGLIVKATDWAKPLAGVPLEAEVLDARGLTVKREAVRVPAGGFMELTHTTQLASPTGTYTVNLNIVRDGNVLRQIGSTSVKVQEFLPDRMKASAQLVGPGGVAAALRDGWVSPKDLKGHINAQNLFGTPAENRRVELGMTLSPAYPAFRAHADYSFYDPLRAKEGFSDNLPEGKTDAKGDADFDLNLARYARATYRLSLLAKVFEPEGGRSVAAEVSVLVSDLAFLVGVKHDGDLNFVSRGSKRISQIISIGPQAQKRATDGLTLQRVERKVVSVLMRQANETYRYESQKKEAVVSEQPLAIPAAGFNLALDTRMRATSATWCATRPGWN